MFVKICGTTSLEDAQLAIALGADALGFIFAQSKRHVSVEQAAEITRQLPPHTLHVGVFTEFDVEEILRTVQVAGLGGVQMHWRYDAPRAAALRERIGDSAQLWQVVGFVADAQNAQGAEAQFAGELRAAVMDGLADAVLLDSVMAGSSGGLGQAFSWERAKPLVEATLAQAAAIGRPVPRIVLAGGLQPENVVQALQVLTPWGVDVVSGVEAGPGKKSPDRLKAFLAAAKQS